MHLSPLKFSVFFSFILRKFFTYFAASPSATQVRKAVAYGVVRIRHTHEKVFFSTLLGLPTETQRVENYCTPNTRHVV